MIAVITPTIKERSLLLRQCEISVKEQTFPCSHFIKTDFNHEGCGTIRNQIVFELPSEFDWLAFLDDDDLFLPHHLETLYQHSDADVIYSDCETVGWHKTWKTGPLDIERLKVRNYIPVTVLIRRSVFEDAGGFSKSFAEDWELWKKLAASDCRFKYVPQVTWQYRQLPGYSRMLNS